MADEPDQAQSSASPVPPKPAGKTVTTTDLFDGRREILIEHAGEMYRLRITRRNKLILQK